MIYFLDKDPKLSAKYLMDKHISCMLGSCCTVLCTILHNNDIEVPQKILKGNNTIVQWASISKSNFEWLRDYGIALLEEFYIRYGTQHKTTIDLQNIHTPDLPKISLTEFPQMILDRYKIDGNPVEAYRNYYVNEKGKVSGYKNELPYWFLDKLDESHRTLYMDFFEEINNTIRVYRDKNRGIVIQKKVDDFWINLSDLKFEEKILLERILEQNVNKQ